ncbi:hypothetical protein LOD99_4380 [Oopsacas minuta]|uniref:Uncharacterized protein n=1 Tax=Oopsacas minuta TaxID=111878 RepID=A0AAV7JW02_9METZ|nr:hypothetical protein LOD99_4380 [Oopsacas minuta]
MTSNSLTDLCIDRDDLVDQSLLATKSLTDLTLSESSVDTEFYSATEDKHFELELTRKVAELHTELLTLVISNIEAKMSAINSEILNAESELASTVTCLSALDTVSSD